VELVLCSDLIGLAKSVVIDDLCFLALESAKEGLSLVAANGVNRLKDFFSKLLLYRRA